MNLSTLYTGRARKIEPEHVETSATALEIPYAAMMAVLEVEARASGFYPDGRLVMLYEPHIAYRYSGEKRTALVRAGLAAKSWGMIPYPASPDVRYAQFEECAKIAGVEVACLSCSWGLPQGMGFNHVPFGYQTAEAMVRAFSDSEAEQLAGMARFIRANPAMHAALRKLDWAAFAFRYNGSGYRKNRYDERLAAAFVKHNRGRVFSDGMLRRGDRGEDVRELQQLLLARGYVLVADGDFGPVTEQAVRDFQRRAKLKVDGVAGTRTFAALRA